MEEHDEEEKQKLGFSYWKSIPRSFGPDSPFFASGNIERELLAKQVLNFLNPVVNHFTNAIFS